MGSPRGRVVVVVGIGDLNSVLWRIFSGLLVSVVVVVASAFVCCCWCVAVLLLIDVIMERWNAFVSLYIANFLQHAIKSNAINKS
jgi:hypothetical protein